MDRRSAELLSALAAALWLGAAPARGGELAVTVEGPALALPDAAVVDQFGTPRRFREALGEGVFVLGFTYAECVALCLMSDNWMAVFADRRGELEAPVRLVTLTLDPEHDRPEALLARHRDFGSPEDWLRLTGSPAEVTPLLFRLGARDGRPIEEHELLLFVGDARSGRMTAVRGEDPMVADRLFDAAAGYAR